MITFLQIPPSAAALGFLAPMVLILLGVFLLPYIFYLITLQNTLKAVSPENRTMEPGMVWLLFIPLFSWIWHFFVVTRIADSVQAELAKKGVATSERPAYGVGLAMCILSCTTWIPILGGLAALAGLICWIIYWIKINEFKKQIQTLEDLPHDDDSLIFGKDPI